MCRQRHTVHGHLPQACRPRPEQGLDILDIDLKSDIRKELVPAGDAAALSVPDDIGIELLVELFSIFENDPVSFAAGNSWASTGNMRWSLRRSMTRSALSSASIRSSSAIPRLPADDDLLDLPVFAPCILPRRMLRTFWMSQLLRYAWVNCFRVPGVIS